MAPSDNGPTKPSVDDTDPAIADTHTPEPEGDDTSRPGSRGPRSIRIRDTLGGRYEINDELGEGGMATVFRARDTKLRREVAIKVLFPHLARRDEVVRRFQREARAAAGLVHPNILTIYDVGSAEGDDPPFIVMEIIRGRSLLQEIEQRGPMFPEVTACIGALLADALAAAHKAAIVHRDIKPANVMIAENGRLLLTDFGVARLETEDSSLVTKTGALLGTPAYMSPEQASGDTATAKSDLYSLGATLYQLATGTLPYSGSPARVLAQIASGALVAPAKKRPAVGPDLSRIIERLMQTEPEQRIPTAAQTATELRALATSSGFADPNEELAAYFTDPEAFVAAKKPKVVTAVLEAGQRAITDGKLPRAMALADRANVLAPDDPAVTALIERVAKGGRSMGRRRAFAIVGVALVLALGGTFAALKLLGGDDVLANQDAAVVVIADEAAVPDPPPDTPAVVMADAGEPASSDVVVDAASRPRIDAGVKRIDASTGVAVAIDASVALIDASVVAPVDAAAGAASIVVKPEGGWCEVLVDGDERGRAGQKPFTVTPGRHTVTCRQSGITDGFTQTIEVAAGETKVVTGSLFPPADVTIATSGAVTIDGTTHRPGAVVKLKRGSHEITIGGVRKYQAITPPCRLKDDFGCYRQ